MSTPKRGTLRAYVEIDAFVGPLAINAMRALHVAGFPGSWQPDGSVGPFVEDSGRLLLYVTEARLDAAVAALDPYLPEGWHDVRVLPFTDESHP